MSPIESHYIDLDSSCTYERAAVHFHPNMFQPLDPEGILLKPILDRKPGTRNLYKSSEFQNGSAFYWKQMESPVGDPRFNVLSAILAFLNELHSIYSAKDPSDHTAADTLEHQILRYLNDRLYTDVSLDDLYGCSPAGRPVSPDSLLSLPK